MLLNQKLFESVSDAAVAVTVVRVYISNSYTAVTTSVGGVGIAVTGGPLENNPSAPAVYEGRPAIELLEGILVPDPMLRTMALALINALNRPYAAKLPEDRKNKALYSHFKLLRGARVAMVGYFAPLARYLEAQRIPLAVIDKEKNIGNKKTFYCQLQNWAEVLILTATSIINGTMEELLSHGGPQLQSIILGPSTPMLPQAFEHLPVNMLAGTVITNRLGALKVVRHAGGPRALAPFSRKVYCLTRRNGADNLLGRRHLQMAGLRAGL